MDINDPQRIHTLDDLIKIRSHPYRLSEYLTDETNIYEVNTDDNINEALLETHEPEGLLYMVNWEYPGVYTEDGTRIPSAYGDDDDMPF